MGRKKQILSFNDIVFEDRNTEYGAYVLRKKYNFHLTVATLSAVILVGLSVIIPYLKILNKTYTIGYGSGRKVVSLNMEEIPPPPEQIYVPPVMTPPPPEAKQTEMKYVAPVIVDSVPDKNLLLPPAEEVKFTEETNTDNISSYAGTGEDELFGETGSGNAYDYFIIEVPPKFRGGDVEKFREWLIKRVIYPQEAMQKGIEGKVYLTFIVEPDGSVSNVNIVKGVDKLLDDEAVKAIEASPKWSPGLQRGRPVRVRFSIYLNFAL
ncbi:MAG: energy transducer TonB [Bacteroidales bacterium]|nr:energy transducer TonB [Bacteroidales bacterium]